MVLRCIRDAVINAPHLPEAARSLALNLLQYEDATHHGAERMPMPMMLSFPARASSLTGEGDL
jgi:hypothetical protein